MTRWAKDVQVQNPQTAEAIAASIAELMGRYSFEPGHYALTQWIEQWLAQYPPLWLRGAVIEALYQGRYKAVSVWQILDLWQRRGQPLQHFNREFERMVSGRSFQLLFPAESLASISQPAGLIALPASQPTTPAQPLSQPPGHSHLFAESPDLAIHPNSQNGSASQICLTSHPAAHPTGPAQVIQPFQPQLDPKSDQLLLPDRRRQLPPPRQSGSAPVQRFVPLSDRSEFHSKLKSIADALVRANAQAAAIRLAAGGPTVEPPSVPEVDSAGGAAEHN